MDEEEKRNRVKLLPRDHDIMYYSALWTVMGRLRRKREHLTSPMSDEVVDATAALLPPLK
jgi:hypothetical protein